MRRLIGHEDDPALSHRCTDRLARGQMIRRDLKENLPRVRGMRTNPAAMRAWHDPQAPSFLGRIHQRYPCGNDQAVIAVWLEVSGILMPWNRPQPVAGQLRTDPVNAACNDLGAAELLRRVE